MEKQDAFLTFDLPGTWKMSLGIGTGLLPPYLGPRVESPGHQLFLIYSCPADLTGQMNY